MRRRIPAALAGPVLVLALLVSSGCGGSAAADKGVASVSDAKAGATVSASPAAFDGRKFAQCMRDNGFTEFPDPGADGHFDLTQFIGLAAKTDTATRQRGLKAFQACRALAPNGGQPPKLNAEQQQQLQVWTQCMRDNGINLPDPDPDNLQQFQPDANGNLPDLPFDPADPKFLAAIVACRDKFVNFQGGVTG
jgi:hypothetical protein